MLWARVLADAIVVFHACYVAFVVLGLLVTVVGSFRGWGWVRNFWFRAAHLAAIGVVVLEEGIGMRCPLTVWEARLRVMGGQEAYRGDFLGEWAHRLIFVDAPPWAFSVAYVLFGVLVLAVFVIAPPRRPGRSTAPRV
ncbi:MAG: DUF2784 domain-containing protein [Isosphaeraceae bacterium]